MSDPTTEPGRFTAYLRERFPPLSYALLSAVFVGAGALAAIRLGGGEPRPQAALVVLAVFFHLRVADEHKDHARDRETHPERLLSRGVVTLPMLARWGAAAIAIEGALAASLGLRAFVAWAGVLAFSLAMRHEFGAPRTLSRSMLLTAVVHNPVVALLALFVHASTGASWDARYLLFVTAATFASLAFEIARKTRLPSEEIAGVPSYSSVYGRDTAGALVAGCASAAAIAAVLLNASMSPSWAPLVPVLGGLAATRGLSRPGQPSSRVELGASLGLIGTFLGIAVAAW